MAISTNGTVLARLAGGLYNTTLSNATYAEVVAVVKTAADINALANDLYARDFASQTDLAVATTLVSNLGLSSTVGLNNWVAAQLTAAGAANKGAKIVSLLNDFANLTSDATYGAAATAFNNKAAAALALSQTSGSAGGDFDAAATLAAAEAAAKAAADAAAAAAAAAAKAAADAAAAKAAADAAAAAEAAAAAAKAAADKAAADAAAAENAPQTFTLTTGVNRFTGKGGDDTFDAADIATSQTWTTADSLDGGAGTDSFYISSSSAIAAPTGASVTNVETAAVTSASTVTLNTTGWTGLTSLTSSSVGATTLTAASTTDVTAVDATQGAGAIAINGGKNVTVTGSTSVASTGVGGTVTVGATTAAAGAVTITENVVSTNVTTGTAATGGAIAVTGGTSVNVTQNISGASVATANVTVNAVGGAVSVTGDSSTTSASVTQTAAVVAVASNTVGVHGIKDGAVTIADKNAGSTTAAGTITTASLTNYGDSTIDSNALTTVNLQGTGGTLGITTNSLTTAANTALALNVNGLSYKNAGTNNAITIDSDVTTLNITSSTASSTVNNITASGATTVNVAGNANLTMTNNTFAAVTAINVTNTGATSFGTALDNSTTFTGGAGAETITVGATTKTITTGGGNDTVTLSVDALGTGGSVDAGDGTADVLKLTTALANTASATGSFETSITGFERLEVSNSAASNNLNLANLDDINYVLSNGSAGTLTITGAQNGFTLVQKAAATAGHTVSIPTASDGTADSMTFKVTAAASTAAGTLTANSFETINVESDDTATTPAGAVDHSLTISSTGAKTLVFSGDASLTLTDSSTALTSVNASSMTDQFTWGTVGGLLAAATITGGSAADSIGSTANTATKSLNMNGGAGQDTLVGGAGNDTITDTSVETNGNGNNLSGGNGNDTITGGEGKDTIAGGAGVDSLIGAGGADAITTSGGDYVDAGAGNDTINAGTGVDTIEGGSGDDTYAMAAEWGTTDVITDSSGTADEITVTVSASLTAGTTTGVETVTTTFSDGFTLALAAVSGVSTLNITGAANATVTGLNSGATVVNADSTINTVDIDTATGASVTYNIKEDQTGGGTTFRDAASVIITNTSSTAGLTAGVALDADDDTVSLTVAAGSLADLTVGAVTNAGALSTVALTAQTASQDLIVASFDDVSSLTSLTLTADAGNVSISGAVGADTIDLSGDALATVNVTATNGATATLTSVFGDSVTNGTVVDSTDADLAMTVSGIASGAASTVDLGTIDNTYGTITLNASGEGSVGSTSLIADDLTVNVSAAGTHALITASDDITITATNSGNVVFTTLTAGTGSTASTTVNANNSGTLEIGTVSASAGTLTVNGASATGAVKVGTTANSLTGAATLIGGSANDSLVGGAGNDTITGNSGDDSLDGGAGNDTLIGGVGNDVLTAGSGIDSLSGGEGDDTLVMAGSWGSTDTVNGGDGNDTVTVNLGAGSISGVAAEVEHVTVTATTDGGTVYATNFGSALVDINLIGTSDDAFTVSAIASGLTVNVDSTQVGDLTLDTATSASITVDIGATTAVAIGDLTMSDVVGLTINSSGGASGATIVNAIGTLGVANTDDLVLDDSDTTSLTVTTSVYAGLTITDDITSTNALRTVSVTTSTGAFVVDAIADATALTTLTLSANGSDGGDITIGNIGTDNNANAAGALKTVTMTAANGADITVALIDGDTAATDASVTTITLTASTTGSVITVDAIDVGTGSIGTVNISAVSGATIDMDAGAGFTAATISEINVSGAGTFQLDGTNQVTTLSTLNTSGTTTGAVVNVDLSSVTNAVNVTLGAGTNSLISGAGNDNITLGAGADSIKFTAATQGQDTITGFVSANDDISFDISAFSTGAADGTIVTQGNATNVAVTVGGAGLDVGYLLKAANSGSTANVDENELTDLTAVAALIADTFTVTDGDTTTADQALFVIEAADVAGVFAVYAYTDAATNNTTVSAAELTLLGVFSGDSVVIGDITFF